MLQPHAARSVLEILRRTRSFPERTSVRSLPGGIESVFGNSFGAAACGAAGRAAAGAQREVLRLRGVVHAVGGPDVLHGCVLTALLRPEERVLQHPARAACKAHGQPRPRWAPGLSAPSPRYPKAPHALGGNVDLGHLRLHPAVRQVGEACVADHAARVACNHEAAGVPLVRGQGQLRQEAALRLRGGHSTSART